MRKSALILILFAAIFLAGCGADQSVTTLSKGTIESRGDIPDPVNEVVLKVTGLEGGDIALDMDTLERFTMVEYTVNDPWLQEDVTYSGVLLSDILSVLDVENYTEIDVIALDGYDAPVARSEIEKWPVLLATRTNGAYMDIENSGPTRIIFPYDQHDDLANARNMSVWNVETLEIR